ncbi:MAG: DNA polymerase III subunit delta [Gemmatimonadaceae bacterium]
MSPATDLKTLHASVRAGTFSPVYYFYGDDDYVKEQEIRRVIEAAVDPATRDFNFEVLRGADVGAETLGSIIGTPPMMAERRVVVVRDVGALKKGAREMLDKCIKQAASDQVLILVSPAGAKPEKALLGTTANIEFKPLAGTRIPKWIAYYVEHDLESTITAGAITLLQEAVGTELSQLQVELDKLVSFTGGGAITEAAVSRVVGVRPGETLGDLLDAVGRRDAATALAMVPTVLQQPKSGGVLIVLALTVQTLGIGWAQAARARGANPGRLYQDLINLLKETGAYPFRAWGEFASTCVRASETWTPRAVDDALAALLAADVTLKTTRLSSDEQLIANLVASLCGASSRQRAA